MKRSLKLALALSAILVVGWIVAVPIPAYFHARILVRSLSQIADIIEPEPGATPHTLTTRLKIVKATGSLSDLAGRTVDLAFQAPDHLRISGDISKTRFELGRDGQNLWIYDPATKFGVLGSPGLPRFASEPGKADTTQMSPIHLPVTRNEFFALPMLVKVNTRPREMIGKEQCQVLHVVPKPSAIQKLKIPEGELTLWIRERDHLPVRADWSNQKGSELIIECEDLVEAEPWPSGRWKPAGSPGVTIQKVALSHVTKFIPAALSLMNQDIPTLPESPAGNRRVLATEGQGRLEMIEGTKVLFLKGTPEEMGRQQGTMMKKEVRNLVDRILYGVGVGSSFEKGHWFFGDIEQAQARLMPYIAPRYLREMDALAAAAGLDREEMRLANFFPELFHCSGFALLGDATSGGRIYHGRILDYLRGVGLEPNAVVTVYQPDAGNAWVNIGYAGFVGSVTAMNAKHISIGEMGGAGQGNWDGKPMAELMREVMENASTLDEAVEIMRRGPRTCEYYYVITDGNAKRAVAIAATPTKFDVMQPGQFDERLPHPFKDAVLLSAGDRYERLAERVKEGYGTFNAESARHLMDRPVAMKSNIHSVLFAPDTLDFWVANADSHNVASETRYTHYNLATLLGGTALNQYAGDNQP